MGKERAKEITQLAPEAKILAMPLLWLHGKKKQKRGKARGRDKETEREANTDTNNLTADMIPGKRITWKSREREFPPLVRDLCLHHYAHNDSTLH